MELLDISVELIPRKFLVAYSMYKTLVGIERTRC
jgi:hypothetical protein